MSNFNYSDFLEPGHEIRQMKEFIKELKQIKGMTKEMLEEPLAMLRLMQMRKFVAVHKKNYPNSDLNKPAKVPPFKKVKK